MARLLLLGCLALAVTPEPARAQAQSCTLDLLGNKYDVFVIPRVGGLVVDMRALNNVKFFDTDTPFATAVGSVAGTGLAVGYSPESGISDFQAPDFQPGGSSAASGVNHDDNVVGWYEASTSATRRAFLFTVEDRFQFLDDLFPAVRDLTDERGSHAWAINDDGQIFLTDGDNTAGQAYLLEPGGTLTNIPADSLDCVVFGGGMLNNDGQLLPAGRRAGQGACVEVHTALNDIGTVAGYEVPSPGAKVAIRDGAELPGGTDTEPTDINNAGYVGGFPGVVWTPDGEKIDIGQAIDQDCNPAIFAAYLDANKRLNQATYINDELWISTESLFLRPARPDVLYGTQGRGFEFFDDGTPEGTGVGVRVGNRFFVDFTLQNIGRNALRNISIDATEDPSLFRLISGPIPPLPASLEADTTFQATSEFEVTGPGVFTLNVTIKGTDPSGVPYEFPQAPTRVIFVGNAGLNAKIKAEPAEVGIGDTFTVTLTAKNNSSFALDDVGPVGALTFLGEADATVTSGPTPPLLATLGPGASQEFVYELEATAGGSMTIHGTLGATTEQGDDVTSEAQCSVGEDSLLAGNDVDVEAPAVCPIDGGAAVEIDLCKLTLKFDTDTLRYAELAGDASPAANTGYKPGMT